MEADFVNDPKRGCRCGEFQYRQWVRGRFLRMRQQDQQLQPVPHDLPEGKQLSPDSWELDGQLEDAEEFIYGRRSRQSNQTFDYYLPDRSNGCHYRGGDSPYIPIEAGDQQVGLDLKYRGEVVHTDASTGQETILISKNWEVEGTYIVRP